VICPACYEAQSRVGKTVDLRDTILRTHTCPDCGATWATEETLRKGSLTTAPVHRRTLGAPNSQGRPPPTTEQPPVAARGRGGVGGGLSSGSVLDLDLADPSRQTDQDHSRAREEDPALWRGVQWYRRFASAWAEKYRVLTMAGSRSSDEATRDLDERLADVPRDARLALQKRAAGMISAFLGDDAAELEKARHPWAWFVTRFDSLQAEAPPRAMLATRPLPA
jgi:hypothetical protein